MKLHAVAVLTAQLRTVFFQKQMQEVQYDIIEQTGFVYDVAEMMYDDHITICSTTNQ